MITNPNDDYARGWIPFLGCKIFLDSRPLIPRTETEFWVEKVIHDVLIYQNSSTYGTVRILDLFSGSGAIGVAVLKCVPNAIVDFGELEKRHFPTIEKNIRENLPADKQRASRIIQTDVWSNIRGRYNFVLANPPYLTKTKTLETLLRDEPPEALFADNGGFALIERTLDGANAHLKRGGILWIEHDPKHARRIGGEIHMDQYGAARYSTVMT